MVYAWQRLVLFDFNYTTSLELDFAAGSPATKFPNRSYSALAAYLLKTPFTGQNSGCVSLYWIRHLVFFHPILDKKIKAQSAVGFLRLYNALQRDVVYVCVITKVLCSNALAPSNILLANYAYALVVHAGLSHPLAHY